MVIKKQANGSTTSKKANMIMFARMERRLREFSKRKCCNEDKHVEGVYED